MENKVIFKAGGERVSVQFCPKSKLVSAKSEELAVLPTKKVVFCAGDVKSAQPLTRQIKRAQNVLRYATPQGISRGELAWKVCDDISVLSLCYDQLSGLGGEYADVFSNMKAELAIANATMQKIAQNLMRQPRRRDVQPPRFVTFCEALSETANLQKQIMTDLRQLQRVTDATQIVLVYLTIQAQNETTQSILEAEC